MSNDAKNHEPVYDAEIFPLMAQIIEICKRENMPMFAAFYLRDDGDEGPLMCTTCHPGDGRADKTFGSCIRIVRDGWAAHNPNPLIAMRIESKPPPQGD